MTWSKKISNHPIFSNTIANVIGGLILAGIFAVLGILWQNNKNSKAENIVSKEIKSDSSLIKENPLIKIDTQYIKLAPKKESELSPSKPIIINPTVKNDSNNSSVNLILPESKKTTLEPKDCEVNKTGDYCFYNKTTKVLYLYLIETAKVWYTSDKTSGYSYRKVKSIFLKPQEKKYAYNCSIENSFEFVAYSEIQSESELKEKIIISNKLIDKGEILIEKCKSNTYTIN